MDWTNFIRTLGHDEDTSMLDPEAYPEEEIEEDLIHIDMDKHEAKNWVDRKLEEYEAKLDEAIEAPEEKKEELLIEADDIERKIEDWQKEWQRFDDQKRLLKAVQTFRRRTNNSRNLYIIRNTQEYWSNETPSSILRKSLQEHMRSEEHVNERMELFTDTSDSDGPNTITRVQIRDSNVGLSESEQRSQALEKQRTRLEIRKECSQSVTDEGDFDWSFVVEKSILTIDIS